MRRAAVTATLPSPTSRSLLHLCQPSSPHSLALFTFSTRRLSLVTVPRPILFEFRRNHVLLVFCRIFISKTRNLQATRLDTCLTMANRVYIGRLSSRATERDVEHFFRGYGKLRDIVLKNGFGFIVSSFPSMMTLKRQITTFTVV